MKRLIPALIITVIGIGVAYFMITDNKSLPIYNPSDINPKLVDESVQGVTQFHRVGNFNLTDQEGKSLTEKQFENKIYVTDFFFVTCPTICPKMATQMSRVYEEFVKNPDILFLSHTVMPEKD